MRRLCDREPRLAVAALNPHASDGGLFGDEERTLIAPAVRQAQEADINVNGPWPCDTLFVRAQRGEFDGVVAMYHDQGHIALKLLSGLAAVNISVGLPIVRTSVAHGTAYDLAGRGVADHRSLIEAARVAAQLTSTAVYVYARSPWEGASRLFPRRAARKRKPQWAVAPVIHDAPPCRSGSGRRTPADAANRPTGRPRRGGNASRRPRGHGRSAPWFGRP